MKAFLKNYRQSPRKVRLVADLVRGHSVSNVESTLRVLPKRAALPIRKLISSAAASAKASGSKGELFVKEICVDEGTVLKRFRPVSRGRAHPIKKRTSRISVVLGERELKTPTIKPKVKK